MINWLIFLPVVRCSIFLHAFCIRSWISCSPSRSYYYSHFWSIRNSVLESCTRCQHCGFLDRIGVCDTSKFFLCALFKINWNAIIKSILYITYFYIQQEGQWLLNLVDYFGATFLIFALAIIQNIGVFWIYGNYVF